MNYRVLQTIWHTGKNKHFEPGEVVNLDHLTEDDQKTLVRMKVVEPIKDTPPEATPAAPEDT